MDEQTSLSFAQVTGVKKSTPANKNNKFKCLVAPQIVLDLVKINVE